MMFDAVGKWYGGIFGGSKKSTKKTRKNPSYGDPQYDVVVAKVKVRGTMVAVKDASLVRKAVAIAAARKNPRSSLIGVQVELSPHLDLWMRGARFGKIRSVKDGIASVKMDHPEIRKLQRISLEDLRSAYGGSRDYGLRENPRKRSRFPLFVVQTIEVPNRFSLTEARKIAERHGARKGGKVDETKNYYRFRQHDPKLMSKRYVSLKLQHAIVVKALPRAIADAANVSDSTKPLTQAELERLWAMQDMRKGVSAAAYRRAAIRRGQK